jgi:tRNA nucleotidyltransferase/poly(A) polymerase
MQVANARESEVDKSIPARALGEELKRISAEDNPAEILKSLDEAGLLTLFSPALSGPKGNFAGLAKFEKISRIAADDPHWRAARWGTFVYALTEKMSPKEKQALVKATELSRPEVDAWQKLEARAKKLETALRSARLKKASQIYHLATAAAPEEVLFLLYHSTQKLIQERLRNYFQKYVQTVQEITPEEWAAVEGKPGTPKHNKAREELITNRLDRRVRKPEPPPPPPTVMEPVAARRGR